jgi:hypothetical protein
MDRTQVNLIEENPGLLGLQVESEGQPGKFYFVSMVKAEPVKWSCTCPDWEFKGKFDGHDCKHIYRAKEWLGNRKEPSSRPSDMDPKVELETLHAIIERILAKDENARNNYIWLIMKVWEEAQAIKIYIPYDKIMKGELYSPESITRICRVVQHNEQKYPPTSEEVSMARGLRAEEFRAIFGGASRSDALENDQLRRARMYEERE